MDPELLQPTGLPDTSLEVATGAGWHVDVHVDIDTTFYGNVGLGIDIEVVAGDVKSTKYHSGDAEGYSRWNGDLPEGLTFEMVRDEVLNRLGAPCGTSDSEEHPAWDRFECGSLLLRVEYVETAGKVSLVTATKK